MVLTGAFTVPVTDCDVIDAPSPIDAAPRRGTASFGSPWMPLPFWSIRSPAGSLMSGPILKV